MINHLSYKKWDCNKITKLVLVVCTLEDGDE